MNDLRWALVLVMGCGTAGAGGGSTNASGSSTDPGPGTVSEASTTQGGDPSGADAPTGGESGLVATDDGAGTGDSSGGPVPLPKALEELVLLEWAVISQNTLADVSPCPTNECAYSANEGQSGVVEDWTGGAFASNFGSLGGLVYWGGGHGGYYGNEVYVFDLETLVWQRRSEPTDGQTPGDANTFGLDLSTGLLWDGSPLAVHTYDAPSYDPSTNSFVLLTTADAPASPWVSDFFAQPYAHRYDLAGDVWVTGQQACPKAGDYLATAYDPAGGLHWAWPQTDSAALSSYHAATDTWVSYADDYVPGIDHVAAIDPGRRLFVACEFRSSDQVLVKDLEDPDAEAVAVTTTGPTDVLAADGFGFEWVEALDSFVAWIGGRPLYLLAPPAQSWQTQPWTWSAVMATGTDPGPMPENGSYSKFQYAPDLAIVLVANEIDGSVFALKLHE